MIRYQRHPELRCARDGRARTSRVRSTLASRRAIENEILSVVGES